MKTDTIQVDQGQAVLIDFTALDVHSSDFLKITDGDGTTLLANTAGSSLPDRVTSQSNVINILFTTNHNGEGTGWSASWHSAPQGQVSHTFAVCLVKEAGDSYEVHIMRMAIKLLTDNNALREQPGV